MIDFTLTWKIKISYLVLSLVFRKGMNTEDGILEFLDDAFNSINKSEYLRESIGKKPNQSYIRVYSGIIGKVNELQYLRRILHVIYIQQE